MTKIQEWKRKLSKSCFYKRIFYSSLDCSLIITFFGEHFLLDKMHQFSFRTVNSLPFFEWHYYKWWNFCGVQCTFQYGPETLKFLLIFLKLSEQMCYSEKIKKALEKIMSHLGICMLKHTYLLQNDEYLFYSN